MNVVFADVDTGVDDAVALVYLLASQEVEVVGVASTGGNVTARQVCVNNLGLLELCGAETIPVSKGADDPLSSSLRTAEDTHGPNGLGYAQLPPTNRSITDHDAAEAWLRAAHAHPGELIGLVTGPLTNLALALRAEPALPELLRRLVIMGGSFGYRGNTDLVAEWNICVDPEAAAEVLAAWSGRENLPIILGLNLTEKIVMSPATLTRLSAAVGCSAVEMNVRDARG
ncbi:MAG: nucleoside hydrolase, partial [Mycobacteriaceae bacterium]|nr:nucleoside hydrolase [Mycobacteriaceae bacterium]